MVTELLKAMDLTVRYDDIVALSDVSIEVGHGEFVAVLGPNGSGKSTLIKACSGIVRPDAGRIAIEGSALPSLSHRERARKIAVVPQSLDALPEVRVHDFVGSGRYAHRSRWRTPQPADRAAVDRALELADVTDCADRPLLELSGGQRQRVLIARALAQESELLLFDEPTVSLDPEHQIAVAQLVRDLSQRGKGVVFVTHDLNLASQFADRAVVLQDGRKVADAPVDEVLVESVLAPVYGDTLLYTEFPGGEQLIVPVRK